MARIGIFCPPISGHIHPMAALGRALKRRGHEVISFQVPEIRDRIEAEQLTFVPLGSHSAENKSISQFTEELGRRKGLSAIRFTLAGGRRLTSLICEYGPDAVRAAGVDLLLVDDNQPAGGTVAEHLNLPFVNVASIPLCREPSVPPSFVPWSYRTGRLYQLRNQLAHAVFNRLVKGTRDVLNQYRAQWGLPAILEPQQTLSRLAILSQLVDEFDFPRSQKPVHLHYLGPLFDQNRPAVAFPFERLDGTPLIYASFGTILNRHEAYFRAVIEACLPLNAQLVISTGGNRIDELSDLSSRVIAVQYAPQLELLARARLCITHAGLNTVMESLRFGVPIVAVPITNDQPAVAARIHYCGAGEVVKLSTLSRGGLKPAVERVFSNQVYRDAAQRIQSSAAKAGGVELGADIVEQILAKHAAGLKPNAAAAAGA